MRRLLGPAALVITLAAVISACADRAPTTPLAQGLSLAAKKPRSTTSSTAASTSTTSDSVVTVLKRSVRVEQDIVRSWVVDEHGGELAIDAVGFMLDVPRGALSGPTLITIRVPSGDVGELVTYEFEPHGLQFLDAVQIKQDLRYTNAYKQTLALQGGYFLDPSAVDPSTETAKIAESYPVTLDLTLTQAKFDIHHFSGYLLASGRGQ